jgi:transcriptional regulator with XRE-family HTH domain
MEEKNERVSRKIEDNKREIEKNRRKIQKKFSHYLRSTRFDFGTGRDERSQESLAAKLGCSMSLIPKLESAHPYPRLYKSLEFLEQFAKLQGISTTEFVSLLEETGIDCVKDPWHTSLLKIIHGLSIKKKISLRSLFESIEEEEEDEGIEGLDKLVGMVSALRKLPKNDKKTLYYLIEKLGEKNGQ